MATRRLSSRAEATPFLPPLGVGCLRVQVRPAPPPPTTAQVHTVLFVGNPGPAGVAALAPERPGPRTLGPVSGLCSGASPWAPPHGCLPAGAGSVWVRVPLCQSAQAPEQRQPVARAVRKVGDRRTGGLGRAASSCLRGCV